MYKEGDVPYSGTFMRGGARVCGLGLRCEKRRRQLAGELGKRRAGATEEGTGQKHARRGRFDVEVEIEAEVPEIEDQDEDKWPGWGKEAERIGSECKVERQTRKQGPGLALALAAGKAGLSLLALALGKKVWDSG